MRNVRLALAVPAAAGALVAALIAGCAGAPSVPPPPAGLFHDELFAPPSVAIDPAAALAVSPAMRRYLASEFPGHAAAAAERLKQLAASLQRGELRIEYDAAITRTAAEAFDARAGNCLALVMMTGALAQALGLSVRYQLVLGEPAWDRADDLYISIGHVNLAIDDRSPLQSTVYTFRNPVIVDFLPPADAERLRTRPIEERRVVAMYLNNRAVESLTQSRLDDAYAWARAALRSDPDLVAGYVTLGVVYRMRHALALSALALEQAALREPDNLPALANRVATLRLLGRDDEAAALAARLEALEPHPPFSYFREGVAAYREGRFDVAQRLFEKEIARAPYHAEFEYWLAITCLQRNDIDRAGRHLARAVELSTTHRDRELYAAKLERLKALRLQ